MWLGHHFQGQRSTCRGAGPYCGGLPHSFLPLLLFHCCIIVWIIVVPSALLLVLVYLLMFSMPVIEFNKLILNKCRKESVFLLYLFFFNALTLLVGWQEWHLAFKSLSVGMLTLVILLESCMYWKSCHQCLLRRLLLQQNLEWLDILVPAHQVVLENWTLKRLHYFFCSVKSFCRANPEVLLSENFREQSVLAVFMR